MDQARFQPKVPLGGVDLTVATWKILLFLWNSETKQGRLKLMLRERLNSGVLQAGNPGACGISPKSAGRKTELKAASISEFKVSA